jgi:hypothetical protein
MYMKIYKHYWNKDQNFTFPDLWAHQKGLFQSRIHLNFIDKRNSYALEQIR